MLKLGGGPRRPTAPVDGSKVLPPTGLLVERRQIADVALNEIGIVEPGSAWMFVSVVGSVKLMTTNALALPLACHSPAFAAVGRIVGGTPLIPPPNVRSCNVVRVMPVVTTTASAETLVDDCAAPQTGGAARRAGRGRKRGGW